MAQGHVQWSYIAPNPSTDNCRFWRRFAQNYNLRMCGRIVRRYRSISCRRHKLALRIYQTCADTGTSSASFQTRAFAASRAFNIQNSSVADIIFSSVRTDKQKKYKVSGWLCQARIRSGSMCFQLKQASCVRMG